MTTLLLRAAALACIAASAPAAPLLFTVLPAPDLTVSGPGTAQGWGYRLENTSATEWIELTNLTADPFSSGTPTLLFDFPILSPLEVRTVNWAAGASGLLEFAFDPGTPAGTSNTGTFLLDANVWDGDPLGQGNLVDVDSASQRYSIALRSSTAIPEPSGAVLCGIAFVLAAASAHRARGRAQRAG